MQSVSDAFNTAVVQDHTPYVKIDVYEAGGTDPIFSYDPTTDTSSPQTSMKIVDGQVTYDKQGAVRTRLSNLKIVDQSGTTVPGGNDDLFAPYGNEIVVSRGIIYHDGTTESVPLGRFRMTRVDVEDKSGGVSFAISGYDRSWVASSATFTTYWPLVGNSAASFPYGGLPITTYIRAMLSYADPAIIYDAGSDDWATRQNDAVNTNIDASPGGQQSYFMSPGDDPWSKAVELAKVVGCSIYFDRYGVCTLTRDPAFTYTDPNVALSPAWTFTEGTTAIFNDTTRSLDTEKTYNRVVVIGEGTSLNPLPLQSTPADDTDPTSPTYINGNFGIRSWVMTNNYLYSQAQVNDYAQLLLRTTLGAHRSVQFGSLVHPALDIDDVVSVTRARIGLSAENYVIDNLTIPLRADTSMSARLREIRQFTTT